MTTAAGEKLFADIEIIYEPGGEEAPWTGYAVTMPDVRVAGASLLQIDLKLAPLLTEALAHRHGEAIAVTILPGGERPMGDGRMRKIAQQGPASLPCYIKRMPNPS